MKSLQNLEQAKQADGRSGFFEGHASASAWIHDRDKEKGR